MKRFTLFVAVLAAFFVVSTSALAQAPTDVTGGATNIVQTEAALQGTVNPNGGTALDYHFEYGPATTPVTYPHGTTWTSVGNGSTAVSVQQTLTSLTPGTVYHYRIQTRYTVKGNSSNIAQGADATFTTASATSVPPSNTALPTISGTPEQGDTLTVSNGTWSGDTPITYTYAWSDGTTGSTDKLSAADVGQNITATVTATNDAGSASATSAAVGPVAALPVPPSNTQAPVISGTPQQGDQLTSSTGTWTGDQPISYTYAWSDGQTGNPITLGSSDVGKTITVTVTAGNDAGSGQATSAGVGPVTASPPPPPSGLVSFAYWLGWEPTSMGSTIAASEAKLPFADLTRVTMFSAEVNPDGTLSLTQNSLQDYNMPTWTATLHQHSVQAFITIGDNNTNSGAWNSACSAATDATFAQNIVNYAVTNGFDGIDLDIENAVTPESQLESCVHTIANLAHSTNSQAGKPLLMSAEQNQSIPTTNPYTEVSADTSVLDSQVNEYYGYNPANNWNCGTGTPWGTCAYVAQLDNHVFSMGQAESKTLLGMATCCGAAQAGYSNLSTTSATVATSSSSIPLAAALSAALPAGNVVVSSGGEANYEVFSTSGAASGATSIPITGAVRGSSSPSLPSGSEVQSNYAGPWDCYNMAAYAKANGYQGNMDFDIQSEYGAYGGTFPCLDQIALGLGLTSSSNSVEKHAAHK